MQSVAADYEGLELRASGDDVELHCSRCASSGVMVNWWVPRVDLTTLLTDARAHIAVMHPPAVVEIP